MIIALLALGAITSGVLGGVGLNQNSINKHNSALTKLKNYANINSNKELEVYLRDAQFTGVIDSNTNKNTMKTYTKLKNNNYDVSKLNLRERKQLVDLYNTLYENDANFKSLLDREYSTLPDDEKLRFIDGASTAGASIPAPAYLDTSFDNYQKNVEPLKLYTNKELAELYDLDYNVDNILADYNRAAQADVDYSSWTSDLLQNINERDNNVSAVSYLDAIRNAKNESVIKGMSSGARAAAEVLANKEASLNKATTNAETATQRFEAMNDALLNRAQAEVNAHNMYTDLSNALSKTSGTLYANDVARIGQDLLTNANILSADENLRSNRQAQNNLMAAVYANASAQNRLSTTGVNNVDWLFKNVYLPAANNNVTQALSDIIGSHYTQETHYSDPMAKWGSGVSK
jgi:hypothetical protein